MSPKIMSGQHYTGGFLRYSEYGLCVDNGHMISNEYRGVDL